MLEHFFPTEPSVRYMNRAEALVYYNRRGMRPGIIGEAIDSASGKALDRAASFFGLKREPAVWLGLKLPWGQRDETLRSRLWLHYQHVHHDPNDTTLHFYP